MEAVPNSCCWMPFCLCSFSLPLWPSLSPSWASNGREKIITFTAFLPFSLSLLRYRGLLRARPMSVGRRSIGLRTDTHAHIPSPFLPSFLLRSRQFFIGGGGGGERGRLFGNAPPPLYLFRRHVGKGRRRAFFNAATIGTMNIRCLRKFSICEMPSHYQLIG